MYEHDTQLQSGGGFFMGLLCGTALGLTAALMFAPFAGSETRERLSSQAQRFRDKTNDAYDRVTKKVDETVKRASQAFADATESMGDEPFRPDYRS